MKRIVRSILPQLALLLTFISGCGRLPTTIPSTLAPSPIPPTYTSKPNTTSPAASTDTATSFPTLPPVNVSCNELSFYLDPALGTGFECKTIPESSSSDIPMDIFIYPAHTELTIQNYPLTHTQFPPQVWIYPVNRFSELLPDVLPHRISELESFISNGTLSSQELPFLPPVPDIQTFFNHETLISFNNGKGVRFITHYNESNNPIDNRTIFYTFQGLTIDGMYWVAVTLPINNPILPDDVAFPPPLEGYTDGSWFQNYNSYVNDVKNTLEAQGLDSFFPTIDSLDSLVRSITVK